MIRPASQAIDFKDGVRRRKDMGDSIIKGKLDGWVFDQS
jgi:hypothetical protein